MLFVGLWELITHRVHNKRWLNELEEAIRIGTNKPLYQHPHINRHRCIGCGSCIRACPEGVLALIHGSAHLIHASQCVGHAYCEQVCPVKAITVGLGDILNRSDIPVLNEVFETSISGVFIIGELGGMALIQHGVNQGIRAVDEIAKRIQNDKNKNVSEDTADILIVGCGPAGIAATLRAKQHNLKYITIDQNGLGGAVRKYPHNKVAMMRSVHIPLYGRLWRKKYRKEQLLEMWEKLFSQNNISVRHNEEWLGVESLPDNTIESKTSKGKIVSRYVVLALGRHGTPHRLNVQGEECSHVFYHLDNPKNYHNQNILVVGGGDSAIEAAIALARESGNHVTISYRREEFFRVRKKNMKSLEQLRKKDRIKVVFNSQVKKIENEQVTLIINENNQKVEKSLSASDYFH